ncbi:MAG: hypothetical protein IJ055_05400 [Oscillospiraceae bacterium]|nr:hypothetical protein [Oscillospiraceae bacterium]
MKAKRRKQLLSTAVCTAVCGMLIAPAAGRAADALYNLAADRILYDAAGNAYVMRDGQRLTGKFVLSPDFTMGDVNRDDKVDAVDASITLQAASKAGAGYASSAQAVLTQLVPAYENVQEAASFSDVNDDGLTNAVDASLILSYSAKRGAAVGQDTLPMGAAYYYADSSGVLRTGFITDGSRHYYARSDYTLVTGWLSLGSVKCCFGPEGEQYFGFQKIGRNTYYFGTDGAMRTGWQTVDGSKYYLGNDGVMRTGLVSMGGRYYDFNENGVLQYGWQRVNNKTYFFDTVTGQSKIGWQTISGGTYYFGTDGVRRTGLQAVDGNLYYFGTDGVMRTGFQTVDGKTYYFDTTTGKRRTGWLQTGGKTYYLGDNGVMRTGLITIGGRNYDFNSAGEMQYGWQHIDNKMYFFDTETGQSKIGWQFISGGTYYFGTDGVRRTGFQTIGVSRYYFNSAGLLQTGFQTIGGKVYYFDASGVMQTGWVYADGVERYMGKDGVMVTGNVDIDGVPYIFDDSGICLGCAYDNSVPMASTIMSADLSPKRSFIIYDRQHEPETVSQTVTISDADIAILEKFAAENFPAGASLPEKLYITHQWIHYNVDYAYAGELWDEIAGCSYVDAIFNHKKGQCVQYNGAMAAMLAYYGFDVYMVKGYTDYGNQHFWTEVRIGEHTYLVECGNYGKNGEWQDFFWQLD